MAEAFIIDAVRTPRGIGKQGKGALAHMHPQHLAATVLKAVQDGEIEMAHTAPYYFYGQNQAFALGSAIPFGFNARQMNAWMLHGNGRRLMDDFYGGYGLMSFSGGNTGTQMGGWYLKELRHLGDFKGMRMRLGGGLVGDGRVDLYAGCSG